MVAVRLPTNVKETMLEQRQPNEPPPIRTAWKVAAFAGMSAAGIVTLQIGSTIVDILELPVVARLFRLTLNPCCVFGATWICLRVLERKPLAAVGIGFDRPWKTDLSLGWVGGMVMFSVCALALLVFCKASLSSSTSSVPSLGQSAWICLCVAAAEEGLFRGYAFQILARWNRGAALVIAGMGFLLLHADNPGVGSPGPLINLALVHVLFAVCYLRTRSLWLPIGVHGGWNFALGSIFGFPVSGKSMGPSLLTTSVEPGAWSGGDFGPEGGWMATIVIVAGIILAMTMLKPRTPEPDLLSESSEKKLTALPMANSDSIPRDFRSP